MMLLIFIKAAIVQTTRKRESEVIKLVDYVFK